MKVFQYFEELASIPRGSGNTLKVSDYCISFAKEHKLEYFRDDYNNVIIRKPASPDKTGVEPIILQGHLDMVCVKDKGCYKNLSEDGITIVKNGDYLEAEATSLGGDDGIAVAMVLAVLDDDKLSHPPIEAVFTSDEEVGMLGAFQLDCSKLKSKRLINIDSEDEGIFTCGCAGGVRVNSSIPVERMDYRTFSHQYRITVSGLIGGHSGVDINKERANSNVVLGRMLHRLLKDIDLRIVTLSGGKFDNAIANHSEAVVIVPDRSIENFLLLVSDFNKTIRSEYSVTDPNVEISADELDVKIDTLPLNLRSTNNVIDLLFTMPNGVMAMNRLIPDFVETSLNLGIVKLQRDAFEFSHLVRSSVESRKEQVVDEILTIVKHFGGSATLHGQYPGWNFAPHSTLREKAKSVYKETTGKEPVINAVHAGLECGLFASKIDGLDCISLGPDMECVHTTKERLSIPSVYRVYDFLIRLLAQL